MNTPDDGGPAYPTGYRDAYDEDRGMSLRARLAMQFAAAWLPAVIASSREWPDIIIRANELGLAMADDLIRRLRENQA